MAFHFLGICRGCLLPLGQHLFISMFSKSLLHFGVTYFKINEKCQFCGKKIMSHINNWSITKINAFWVQNVIYEKRIVLKITISLTINPTLLKYAKHYIFVTKIIVEIQLFFLQDCPWDIKIKNINPRSSRKKTNTPLDLHGKIV